MSDKTVPADADDYQQPDEATQPNPNDDPKGGLADKARQQPGETPNRDEDEFDDDGLKTPKVDPDLQEKDKPTS